MSEAEVEVVRRAGEAYSQRGTDGVVEFLDPEIVWNARADLPDAGTYRGPDGFRHLMARFEEVMDDMHYEPVDIMDLGERVVAQIRWGGKGKASGVDVEESEETWIFTVRAVKIVQVDEFATREAALEAAGVEG